MLDHVRFAINGVLGVVQAATISSVLSKALTEEEKQSYFNCLMECKRLEIVAIKRLGGDVDDGSSD